MAGLVAENSEYCNTTATLCINYRPGHRKQALLPISNLKTPGLSGGKRVSPVVCLGLCMWHGDWLFRDPLVPKNDFFCAQNDAQVGPGVPVLCFP